MISTSFISGTGLKKCMPATRPGWRSPAAIAVTDSDDVLDARIVCGGTIFSSSRSNARFSARSSTIASTTSCALTQSPRACTATIRACAGRRVGGVELALGGQPLQRLRDRRPRLFRGAHPRIEQPHRVSGLRGDLRDAGAHRPAADDGNRGVARQCAGCRHRCPITSGEPRYRPLKRGARFSRNAATPSR